MTIPTEHQEQVNFVNWMECNYPEHRLFAIPNGDKRHLSVAKRLKAEGVRPGVPDLFMPSLFLFIEMKRIKGSSTSKEQKEWIKYLNENNYTAVICKGAEEAKQAVICQLQKTLPPRKTAR